MIKNRWVKFGVDHWYVTEPDFVIGYVAQSIDNGDKIIVIKKDGTTTHFEVKEIDNG